MNHDLWPWPAWPLLYLCKMSFAFKVTAVPSVLWRCWLGGRKSIRPVKLSGGCWRGFCLERGADLHSLWPSWCHCHSLSLASVKARLVLPFWYRLTQVALDKGLLNGCVCVFQSYCLDTGRRTDRPLHKTALADLGFFYRGGGDFGNPSEQSDRTLRGSVGLWENEIWPFVS